LSLLKNASQLFAGLLALTMVNIPSILAQSSTSSALAGSVADKSGAMISNAQVKAIEVNTGAIRTVESNAEGRFLFRACLRS
jgi:hypothetical protein